MSWLHPATTAGEWSSTRESVTQGEQMEQEGEDPRKNEMLNQSLADWKQKGKNEEKKNE